MTNYELIKQLQELPPFNQVLFDVSNGKNGNGFWLAPIDKIEVVQIEGEGEELEDIILMSAPILHGTDEISQN